MGREEGIILTTLVLGCHIGCNVDGLCVRPHHSSAWIVPGSGTFGGGPDARGKDSGLFGRGSRSRRGVHQQGSLHTQRPRHVTASLRAEGACHGNFGYQEGGKHRRALATWGRSSARQRGRGLGASGRPGYDDWDEDEEIDPWLDTFGGEDEEVFLIRDPNDWISGLQPQMAGGGRIFDPADSWEDPFDLRSRSTTQASAKEKKGRGKGESGDEEGGGRGWIRDTARKGLMKLGVMGSGFSKTTLNNFVESPEKLTPSDLLIISLFSIATITFVRGIFFLITFLFRFSLSLFLIIGVSFFCISIIWLVTLL